MLDPDQEKFEILFVDKICLRGHAEAIIKQTETPAGRKKLLKQPASS